MEQFDTDQSGVEQCVDFVDLVKWAIRYGGYTADIWRYMADGRRTNGEPTADIRQTYGGHTANLRQYDISVSQQT